MTVFVIIIMAVTPQKDRKTSQDEEGVGAEAAAPAPAELHRRSLLAG
jgi:hypothetical protein